MAGKKRIMAAGLALLVLGPVLLGPAGTGSASAAASGSESPAQVVKSFQDALLAVWRNAKEMSTEERYRKLEPAVRRAYDLARMIQIATSSAWRKASDAQRQALVQAFTHFSVATYAATFDNYGGERFAIIGERQGPRGRKVVETKIIIPDKEPVSLDYVLHKKGGGWRIIDVVAKGVSELARRRSEYRSILKEGGPDLLAERLNALADKRLKE